MLQKIRGFFAKRHDMGWGAEILAWLMVMATITSLVKSGAATPNLLTGAIFTFLLYCLAEMVLAVITAVLRFTQGVIVARRSKETETKE